MSKIKLATFQKKAVSRLKSAGIGTAALDVLILLEDELNKDRARILAHPEISLDSSSLQKLNAKIELRVKHVPLSYIRKKIEFYGRDFYVDERVLVPRPESELIITLLKNLLDQGSPLSEVRHWKVVDVGTGSGALAVSAKLELPKIEVAATDIDPNCLVVARKNARLHKVRIDFFKGNLLKPLTFKYDSPATIILANLPYVPEDFYVNEAASQEPRHAIFGGRDGLDVYRQLFLQTTALKQPPRYVLTESLPPQHQRLTQIARKAGYTLSKSENYITVFERQI